MKIIGPRPPNTRLFRPSFARILAIPFSLQPRFGYFKRTR
jgi:hypothetical protein